MILVTKPKFLHSYDNKPALIENWCSGELHQEFYKHGKLHRETGPSQIHIYVDTERIIPIREVELETRIITPELIENSRFKGLFSDIRTPKLDENGDIVDCRNEFVGIKGNTISVKIINFKNDVEMEEK